MTKRKTTCIESKEQTNKTEMKDNKRIQKVQSEESQCLTHASSPTPTQETGSRKQEEPNSVTRQFFTFAVRHGALQVVHHHVAPPPCRLLSQVLLLLVLLQGEAGAKLIPRVS